MKKRLSPNVCYHSPRGRFYQFLGRSRPPTVANITFPCELVRHWAQNRAKRAKKTLLSFLFILIHCSETSPFFQVVCISCRNTCARLLDRFFLSDPSTAFLCVCSFLNLAGVFLCRDQKGLKSNHFRQLRVGIPRSLSLKK